ncbi:glucose-6-phosphate isomerase, partial [Achromobacter xylosoxidans]
MRVLNAPGLRLDLSAQAYSPDLQKAEAALLEQQGFDAARSCLFDGGNANWTEQRAAWHTALRAPQPPARVAKSVLGERERMRES